MNTENSKKLFWVRLFHTFIIVGMAIKYGDNYERFYDSFLPKKFTPFVVPGLTVIFFIGLVLVLI